MQHEAAKSPRSEALASAVATLSNYTDVDRVILGGYLPQLFDRLEPYVQRLIDSRAGVAAVSVTNA